MKKLILATFLCVLSIAAEAVTPTPTPTPLTFGKIPHDTDVFSDAGWTITNGKLITPVSGGGIEGTIADGQVAFGEGTAIAGSEAFKWYYDESGGYALVFTDLYESHNPAQTGNIRLPSPFSIYGRNSGDDGDNQILLYEDGGVKIGDTSVGYFNTGGEDFDIEIQASSNNGVTISSGGGSIDLSGGPIQLGNDTTINANTFTFGVATIYGGLQLYPMTIATPTPTPSEGFTYANSDDHHPHYYDGTDDRQIVLATPTPTASPTPSATATPTPTPTPTASVPIIQAATRVTAQSAANSSIATFTVGGADGSFEVSMNMNVSAALAISTAMTCNYTDETNTSRSMIFPTTSLSGAFLAGGLVTATGAFETPAMHIRCKASTSITLLTATGTFSTVTYTAEGVIKQTQ